VVPYSVHDSPQFPLDGMAVVHRVEPATVLDPPQPAAMVLRSEGAPPRDAVHGIDRECGPCEPDRMARIPRHEVDRVTEQVAGAARRGQPLAELLAGFGAHPKRSPGEKSHRSVARGIAEERSRQFIPCATEGREGEHVTNGTGMASIGGGALHRIDGRIEQESDPRLRSHHLQQQRIDEHGVAFGVAVHVFDENFVDYTALAGPTIVVAHVAGGAEYPEANFAGCIAAQHGSILHEDNVAAGAGGSDRRARTCETAAHDDQIGGDAVDAEGPRGTGRCDEQERLIGGEGFPRPARRADSCRTITIASSSPSRPRYECGEIRRKRDVVSGCQALPHGWLQSRGFSQTQRAF
jgi:hypothetical protein